MYPTGIRCAILGLSVCFLGPCLRRISGGWGGRNYNACCAGVLLEQDLLGLLTAARGGLSGTDLAELVGVPLWEIEEILHTVAGRTFIRRASLSAPPASAETYLLGHEELQTAAARYLDSRLAAHRDRLHAWASIYRGQHWPSETPEYLLVGYYGLLASLGDVPRMIACAIDPARHDRMLYMTGGDTAGLAEVRTALDVIATQDSPDLASALALACHRDRLTERNINIPVGLPAIWAALGQATRAETLATSITDPTRQSEALAQVAGALARAGQHQRAETLARSLTDSYWQAGALAQVAGALARAGQHQQAEALTTSITEPTRQSEALAQVAGALTRAGQHQRAETLARSLTDSYWQAGALAQVAGALARAGQHQQAEALTTSITDPCWKAEALALVAGALAITGQHQQARAAATQAETKPAPSPTQTIRARPDPDRRGAGK